MSIPTGCHQASTHDGEDRSIPDRAGALWNDEQEFPKKTLIAGAFIETWERFTTTLLDYLIETTGLRPIVLLPHDILIDQYAPRHHVEFAGDASACLRSLEASSHPKLVFVDHSLANSPCSLTSELNRVLSGAGLGASILVVVAPDPTDLNCAGFDQVCMLGVRIPAYPE